MKEASATIEGEDLYDHSQAFPWLRRGFGDGDYVSAGGVVGSDLTPNRHGVRIGAAELYRAVEQAPEVADSLIVCCELPGGTFFMPLFLKLKAGAQLDDALVRKIGAKLREDCSPRHVPDRMYQSGPRPSLSRRELQRLRSGRPPVHNPFPASRAEVIVR